MVAQSVVSRKLTLLEAYSGYLETLAQHPADEFAASFLLVGAARYYLQVAIECCLDIGAHTLASDTSRRAEDYRSIIRLLAEEGILSAATASALEPAAALRNRLVHGYDRVDDAMVHGMLSTATVTFQSFARELAAYLDRNQRPAS